MFILLVAGGPNIRFGSIADLALAPTHVRYVPSLDIREGPMVDDLPSIMHTRKCCGVANDTASIRATG